MNSRDGSIKNIPPFFIYKKTGTGWDVQFLGLAAPGNPKLSPDKDLVAFWRTIDEKRFQNYEAYFTVLDTYEPISRAWLNALIYDHENSLQFAPDVGKRFIKQGRNGIMPLIAKKLLKVPDKYAQLQSDNEGMACLEKIRTHYAQNAYGFENSLTRPWRDGGRDALEYYVIGNGSKANYPLRIDCALEAKCYSPNNSVGVREMSRLILRIRYRQFGIMMTTRYVHKQAYEEVIEDGHPLLIVSACDIAQILRHSSVTSENIDEWLDSLDQKDRRIARMSAYNKALTGKTEWI